MVNTVLAPNIPVGASCVGMGVVAHISFAYIYLTKECLLATPDSNRLGIPNCPLGTGHHKERLGIFKQ